MYGGNRLGAGDVSSDEIVTTQSDKQAVVVIHGIGEQRPMATLRGFVDAVWTRDESVHHKYGVATVWSKPDTVSGSFELHRLTTGRNAKEVRTDFFELYWAHLMHSTGWRHVTAWAKTLLVRWPWKVPRSLLGAWLLLVILALTVGFFALEFALPESVRWVAFPRWTLAAATLFTALITGPVVKGVVGDAARYLDASPPNIQRRQEIRARGVELLRTLHEKGDYRRIVVVGHSLGSVIGYDILTYAWATFHDQRTQRRGPYSALDRLEELAREPGLDLGAWRRSQRRYFDELREVGCGWRVTDFVTAGSPLAHAAVLLAADEVDLRSRQNDRELPTCPPRLERDKFSFPRGRKNRTPHHAAVFAPTRWTNLYFPARFLLWGDLIGGPLRPVFGRGVQDVPVTTRQRGGLLSHTLYWRCSVDDDPHVVALRKAIDLLDEDAPAGAPAGG